MGMVELVTSQGGRFWSSARVHIGDQYYDMDALNEAQAAYVAAKLNEQGLSASLAGRGTVEAGGLPPIEEVFPDMNKEGNKRADAP